MERLLAILIEDEEYARGLAAYLSKRPDFIFKPVVFSDIDSYLRFETKNHVDMLLCNERIAMNEGNAFKAENICVLSEYALVAEEECPEFWEGKGCIYKYQNTEALMKNLISYYGKQHPASPGTVGAFSQRTITVCSPMGGSYCSTYALALAEYFSRGGRTLFISFDPFFLLPGEVKNYSDKNLTDVIYYLQLCKSSPAVFVEKIARHRGNLDYVSGVSHLFDVADMTSEQMRTLFTSLCESDKYETMVFDLGIIGSAGMELLAGCSKIYVPRKKGGNYEAVFNEWSRQLSYSGQTDIAEKVIERELPYDELLDGEFTFDRLLKGTLGRYIDESEGLGYLKH